AGGGGGGGAGRGGTRPPTGGAREARQGAGRAQGAAAVPPVPRQWSFRCSLKSPLRRVSAPSSTCPVRLCVSGFRTTTAAAAAATFLDTVPAHLAHGDGSSQHCRHGRARDPTACVGADDR